MLSMNDISSRSRNIIYMLYKYCLDVTLESTNDANKVIVKSVKDKSQTVEMSIEDIKKLVDNNYIHLTNARISPAERLVTINIKKNDNFKAADDIEEWFNLHPKVRKDKEQIAEQQRKEKELEESRLKQAIENQIRLQELEKQRLLDEELYKTPRGKLIKAQRTG